MSFVVFAMEVPCPRGLNESPAVRRSSAEIRHTCKVRPQSGTAGKLMTIPLLTVVDSVYETNPASELWSDHMCILYESVGQPRCEAIRNIHSVEAKTMRQSALRNPFESRKAAQGRQFSFLRFAAFGFMALLAVAMMMPLAAKAQLSGKGAITGTVKDEHRGRHSRRQRRGNQ